MQQWRRMKSWKRGEKEALGFGSKEAGGRWRGGKTSRYSWQCIGAFVIASGILLYSLAILGGPCWQPAHYMNLIARGRQEEAWAGDLRELETAWNRLCFGPAPEQINIALFVKKWPVGGTPGGLERHALTLHKVLADRGHQIHVFTCSGDGSFPEDQIDGNFHIHFLKQFDYAEAWNKYAIMNSTNPFHIVHSESVALPHWRAQHVPNLAASWHGIAYEVIHSDVVHDLIRKPGEARSVELQQSLAGRLSRVADEVRFFHSYHHHVATSDYVGDVLRTIYELPLQQVHIILNGVDEKFFRPDPAKGVAFRAKYGVPANASLVLGAAGRLVRDKGHPLLFEAFSEILKTHKDVYLLVAGKGPWADRYKELAPNVKTLGPMTPAQLAEFYNALDIFVNPTLRSQGLDHTLLEAMQCGKPLLATHFSSITWSVIINKDFGYTFSPNVGSLVKALESVIQDGKEMLRFKGQRCLRYASLMFTATKMGSAYERLFLCMKNESYCHYPLPTDCAVQKSGYARQSLIPVS